MSDTTREEAAKVLDQLSIMEMAYMTVDRSLACVAGAAALRSPAPGAAEMREAAAKVPESKTLKRLNAQVNRLYQIANQLSDERECDTRAVDIRMAAAAMKKLAERRGRALPAREVPEATIQISALLWCSNCQKARLHERSGFDICCTDCRGVTVTEHD